MYRKEIVLSKGFKEEEVMHLEFLEAKKRIYEPIGFFVSDYKEEDESKEYGALSFKLDDLCVKFRVGKVTPTKAGQFVTFWKRIGKGPILPYDLADPFDLFVVSARSGQNFGLFVFPKGVLQEKGILSKDGKGGKRAMRIYSPWDSVDSKQAKQTKKWQISYFVQIDEDSTLENKDVKKLFLK